MGLRRMPALLPSPLPDPLSNSRRWLCRAHGIPSLPVMPRPNTGLKCNGGQGVAPPSTTAAAGSLHQDDVLLSCGVVRVQDALHPIKMWTDTPCLSTGPRGYPGHLPFGLAGLNMALWIPVHVSEALDHLPVGQPSHGHIHRGLRSGSVAVTGTWGPILTIARTHALHPVIGTVSADTLAHCFLSSADPSFLSHDRVSSAPCLRAAAPSPTQPHPRACTPTYAHWTGTGRIASAAARAVCSCVRKTAIHHTRPP